MLSRVFIYFNAECRYAEYRFAERRGALSVLWSYSLSLFNNKIVKEKSKSSYDHITIKILLRGVGRGVFRAPINLTLISTW